MGYFSLFALFLPLIIHIPSTREEENGKPKNQTS